MPKRKVISTNKTKSTNNLSRPFNYSKYQYVAGFLIILAAILLGYLVFVASHAASPYAKSEAESGTLSGSAAEVSGDSTASGSSYVRFGALPSGGTIAPAGTYVDVFMPAGNLTNNNYDLAINNVPNLGNTSYFWSHQFYFTGGPTGQGGYIGLQGINRAVFSIFDYASTEVSSSCTVQSAGFDGGTEPGTSCIISYPVTQGHSYRLSVTNTGQDSQGINWLGSVEDLTTGQTTPIATVNVASSWGNISNTSIVWTEYFGSAITACSQLPYSNVTFSNFTGNNGQYAISSHSDSIGQNACTNYSRITENSASSFTEEMGIDPPVSQTIVPFN